MVSPFLETTIQRDVREFSFSFHPRGTSPKKNARAAKLRIGSCLGWNAKSEFRRERRQITNQGLQRVGRNYRKGCSDISGRCFGLPCAGGFYRKFLALLTPNLYVKEGGWYEQKDEAGDKKG